MADNDDDDDGIATRLFKFQGDEGNKRVRQLAKLFSDNHIPHDGATVLAMMSLLAACVKSLDVPPHIVLDALANVLGMTSIEIDMSQDAVPEPAKTAIVEALIEHAMKHAKTDGKMH